MKISQEEFSKLNQLDRIEYRQREFNIKERYDVNFSSWSNYFILSVLVFIIVTSIFSSTGTFDKYIGVIKSLSYMMIMFFGLSLVGFFIDIYFTFYKNKKIGELQSEYFKSETKNEKRR